MDEEMIQGLNPQQREAVAFDRGPLVVFAGAGSGKTRVITHRIAHLIQHRGIHPFRILAVTFTNKAAGEMRERLGRMLSLEAVDGLQVGTFHATCARLLRRHAEDIPVDGRFGIYDDADQRSVVTRVLRDLSLDERRYAPRALVRAIQKAKQELLRPDEMIAESAWDEIVQRVYTEYERRMLDARALDFGDLITKLVLALESNNALRNELASRFLHILVDEFQDTNLAQFRLVKALASVHNELTVVGDDDQSIYRWRGADRRNILHFRDVYPSAHVIKLEQNYRSTQRILRAANAVISQNIDREVKRLWTENEEGARVDLVTNVDERDEARSLTRRIATLRAEGTDLADMAVLYRIHSQSRALEESLREANIPYRVIGGLRFYDRAEVKDVLGYLRVVDNPQDDVNLLRIINTPPRGIGKKTIEQLLDRAAAAGSGLWDAAREAAKEEKGRKKLSGFVTLIEELMQLNAGEPTLAELAESVLDRSAYLDWLDQQQTPESETRLQNVGELLGSIRVLTEEQPELTLSDFLTTIALASEADQANGEVDTVSLMTVHGAKGLEFPVVFVTGLEDGLFPLRPRDAADPDSQHDAMEEERRLAYVAITRAESRLVLSWAERRRVLGRLSESQPSRFLSDLPADDVQRNRPAGRPLGGRSMGQARPALAWRSHQRPASTPTVEPGDSYVDRSEGADGDAGGLRVGMWVSHPRFGFGRVTAVKPAMPPRVDVSFQGGPARTILARVLRRA